MSKPNEPLTSESKSRLPIAITVKNEAKTSIAQNEQSKSMDGILFVELPLPPRGTHPNTRFKNHIALSTAIRKQRMEAKFCAMEAMQRSKCKFPFDKIDIQVVQRMPRRHDPENIKAWLKASIDGLQDAGVIVNDCNTNISSVLHHRTTIRQSLVLKIVSLT